MWYWGLRGHVLNSFPSVSRLETGLHGCPPILDGETQCVTTFHSQVELEVPQLCSFIMRTSQCTLKEVYGFNPEGKALMKKTKNSDEFAAAMSR